MSYIILTSFDKHSILVYYEKHACILEKLNSYHRVKNILPLASVILDLLTYFYFVNQFLTIRGLPVAYSSNWLVSSLLLRLQQKIHSVPFRIAITAVLIFLIFIFLYNCHLCTYKIELINTYT